MGKGVLLEMAGRQAVVLTPQGEFKRVPMPSGTWEIGDEVEYAEPKGSSLWARWGATAAAAACLMLGSWFGYDQYTLTLPVAVVTVDINPSLELTLNKRDQVLKAEPLNADGELVLKGVDWTRRPFDEVVKAVTDRAVEEQKLNPADEASAVVVGVAPAAAKELPAAQVERVVEKAKTVVTNEVVKMAKDKGLEPKTNVAVLVATVKEKQEAEKEGLSVGKFMLLPEIRAVAPDVTVEEIKKQGPGAILKERRLDPDELFENAQKRNEEEHQPTGKQKSGEEKAKPTTAEPGGKKNDPPGKADEKKEEPKKNEAGKGNGAQNAPKQQEPRQDEPQKNEPKKDEPKQGGSKPADPKQNAPKQDQSQPKEGKKNEPKKEEPKKNQPKKEEPKQDEPKKNSWTIPFLGITVDKPAFLSNNDEAKPAAVAETPAPSTPRAEEPGAGASGPPAFKRDEPRQAEPKQDEPKQHGSSQDDAKRANGKQTDEESGKEDQKKAEKEKPEPKGKEKKD